MNETPNILARALRAYREQRKMSQNELAAVSGVPQPVISQIENGARWPTEAMIHRLARGFGCAPDEFLETAVLLTTRHGAFT